MVWRHLQAQRLRGRAYQPRFQRREILAACFGGLVAGNTLGAVVSVGCVAALGSEPWVMGLAVGLTIALGQALRCLHPPAGAVALLGVLLRAKPMFVLIPILSGSLVLLLLAVLFSRLRGDPEPYPQHWL